MPRRRNGFTLIELLVVIAIIAILVPVDLPVSFPGGAMEPTGRSGFKWHH